MNEVERSLVFDHSLGPWIFGILLVGITLYMCIWAWIRSGFAKGTGLLEALRLIVVVLVAITVLKPEWRELHRPDSKPTLAVLWDQSNSMQTNDVLDPDDPSAPARTRAEVVEPFTDEEFWWPLGSKMRTFVEPFSSSLDPPKEGTDLHGALERVLEQHGRLRAVVVFSDGDWNIGEPPVRAATKLRLRDVPVFAAAIGSDTRLPDVELSSFDVPTFGVAGKPLRVPFSIESSLPRDYTVEVELDSGNGEIISKQVIIPRKRRGEPHRIEYFHQVEDAYSHLAAQLLRPLLERYDVELVP
ncbi:MAG: vWA domain-containing protein, partial [Verrucomicrobiota bacterium]